MEAANSKLTCHLRIGMMSSDNQLRSYPQLMDQGVAVSGTPSVSKPAEVSGEPELYCQWGDCFAGPMTLTKILEHFRDHGAMVKEGDRVKECRWAGCNAKRGAFPMTSDGFRRHVNETQSHAGIGDLTKVECEACGVRIAKRSMPYHHKKSCSKRRQG